MNRVFCGIVIVAGAGVLLGGCANVSAVRVQGKVITGNVAFIAAIADNDPRLNGPGVEGATVQIVSKNNTSSGVVVGTALSDPSGRFTMKLSDQGAIKVPADFKATAPGYLTSQNTLYIPTSDKRILVVLKKGGDSGPTKPGMSQTPATESQALANRSE